MFLIELKPGIEAIYANLSDFSDAIRRGEIGSQARIYHRSKSEWAPVTMHPAFRRITAEASRPPAAVRTHWTFLPAEPAPYVPAPAAVAGPASADEPTSSVRPISRGRARRWRGVLGGLLGRAT